MYLKITFFINYTRKRKGEYFLYDIFLVTRENDLKKKVFVLMNHIIHQLYNAFHLESFEPFV